MKGPLLASAALLTLSGCQSSELLSVIRTTSGSLPTAPGSGGAPAVDAGDRGQPSGGRGGASDADIAGPPLDSGIASGAPRDSGAPRSDAGAASEPTDVPVSTINDPDAIDTDPTFTADLLELYFMSTREGSKDIFRSRRSDPADPWGTPELVEELSTGGQEENPFVSADGFDLWFFTDRDRSLGSIWHSMRLSREDLWSEPEPVTALTLAEGGSDVSVAVDASSTRFVLNSKLPGAPPYGMNELVFNPATGTFAPPVALDEVNSDGNDFDPDLRESGLFLAFDSSRLGLRQIFFTRRGALDAPFAEPVPLSEVPLGDESAVAFSEDLRYVMFSSIRSGDSEIYERWSTPPP